MPASPLQAEVLHAERSWSSPDLTSARLLALGVLAYAVALFVTLPAREFAPGANAVGTFWHGAVVVPGGVAQWEWSLAKSIGTGSIAFDATVNGFDTSLSAVVERRARLAATHISGRMAWPLLAAIIPALPASCTIPLDIALDRVSAGNVVGTVRSLAGTCPGPTGNLRAVPRMIATFTGLTGRITPWTDRTTTYATVSLTEKSVRLHVTTGGAAVLPGLSSPGDVEIAF